MFLSSSMFISTHRPFECLWRACIVFSQPLTRCLIQFLVSLLPIQCTWWCVQVHFTLLTWVSLTVHWMEGWLKLATGIYSATSVQSRAFFVVTTYFRLSSLCCQWLDLLVGRYVIPTWGPLKRVLTRPNLTTEQDQLSTEVGWWQWNSCRIDCHFIRGDFKEHLNNLSEWIFVYFCLVLKLYHPNESEETLSCFMLFVGPKYTPFHLFCTGNDWCG